MVGASEKENCPGYFAFKYLLERGYNMIPINPGHAGEDLLGRRFMRGSPTSPSRSTWSIFSAPRATPAIVEKALALQPRPQVIWMQLGIRNDEAAALAEANGLKVVMNRCPKIEYGRLSSEMAWMRRRHVNHHVEEDRRSRVVLSACPSTRTSAPGGHDRSRQRRRTHAARSGRD